MIKKVFLTILICLAVMGNATAFAVDVGTTVSPVKLGQFIQGQPVNLQPDENPDLTVLAFWATWCPACKSAFPLLSELSSKYKNKGVALIGVTDEDKTTVLEFLKTNDQALSLPIALDPGSKTANQFDINGIPQVVIIDKSGTLIWQGHPNDGLDTILAELTKDGYDQKKTKALIKRNQETTIASQITPIYLYVLEDVADRELLQYLEDKIYNYLENDSEQLKDVAWAIISKHLETDGAVPINNAHRFIQRANELSDGKDASILDSYAVVQFFSGKIDKAIQYEQKAIEISINSSEQAEYRERLNVFNSSHQLREIPFRWYISQDEEKTIVEVEIQEEFFLYEEKTTVTLHGKNGLKIKSLSNPTSTTNSNKNVFNGGSIYRWEFQTTSESQAVTVQVDYQGCDDKNNICFYPETIKRDIPITLSAYDENLSRGERMKWYFGKIAPVSIASHPKASTIKPLLEKANTQGCNFAGSLTIVKSKTDNNLIDIAVIDCLSGNVAFLPFPVESLTFQINSNIIKFINSQLKEEFLLWENGEFTSL